MIDRSLVLGLEERLESLQEILLQADGAVAGGTLEMHHVGNRLKQTRHRSESKALQVSSRVRRTMLKIISLIYIN